MTPKAAVSGSRILVVDDELGPRESLRMLLKAAYEVVTADSGPSALAELPQLKPDLVILDIKMPQMSGLEVLRRVKEADPSIEVVMITAYASLETVKQALTYGAFEYLIKPFQRQDLEDVVRRALLRRQHDAGTRTQVSRLVEEMRGLSAKTQELEEAARREAAEQSLRVTQLSILREISRSFVGQLDTAALSSAVTEQVRTALGYDHVSIAMPEAATPAAGDFVATCEIRDAEGVLGKLVVDNRSSRRLIDSRERELLEMLAEYLAIALRNSRLYGQIGETKRSLEQLIASAGDAIISVDATTDRVQGWNPAAERIFGLSGAEAFGHSIGDLIAASDFEEGKRKLAAGRSLCAFDTVAMHGSNLGASLAVTLSASAGHLIAIVRDVTTQREMEKQLHQSEKLTALGQLAGGIAHDFNNLLQAILGYTQLMKQSPGNVEFVKRSLAVVEAAANDGSETVRRIQQFARLRPDEQFVPVSVNQVVHDAMAIVRPRWQERQARGRHPMNVELKLSEVPPISGRPAALTEVMTNLILNAMDAMPDGGTLTVTTRPGREHTVLIDVSDTGIGMPEAVQRRIFEPFFSTKGESGSGLGLSMAYSIVKRHGGEIEVESAPGRGTTFTLVFAVDTPQVHPAPHVAPAPNRRAARVLLVDDEPKVRDTLAELLSSTGHDVTKAEGGHAALSQFTPGRFDAVVSNLGMAGMNGWELAERLRAIDRSVAILFVTGWGLREDEMVRMESLRVSRCLFKPVRPDELDTALRVAISTS
jgi:two-component system cell cycle sensor histidine kinase/response regulator CckA